MRFQYQALLRGKLFKLEEKHPEIRICHGNADRASSEGLLTGAARNGAASQGLFPSQPAEWVLFLVAGPWDSLTVFWGAG